MRLVSEDLGQFDSWKDPLPPEPERTIVARRAYANDPDFAVGLYVGKSQITDLGAQGVAIHMSEEQARSLREQLREILNA